MTTSNAAIDKTAASPAPDKAHEKLAEKRRALGRGLESLLPGPRVVATIAPTLPQSARKDGAPSESVASPLLNFFPGRSTTGGDGGRVARSGGRAMPDGDHVVLLNLDQIVENPYQTRTEFDIKELTNLAGSIQTQGVLQPIVVRPARSLPGKTLPFRKRWRRKSTLRRSTKRRRNRTKRQ